MPNQNENNQEKSASALGKYVGMGFQMIIIIGLFTYAGYWLDGRTHNNKHLYTAFLSLLGVLLALWQVIRVARRGG